MKITVKVEAFIQSYLSGKNASDAYRSAYNTANMKLNTINQRAYELLIDGDVAARIDFLKKELADKHLWTREDSLRTLIKVIENPEKNGDIIAAIKEINDMEGFKAPAKQEISGPSGGPITHNLAPVLTPEEWTKAFGGQS